jgi:hypothetical protein
MMQDIQSILERCKQNALEAAQRAPQFDREIAARQRFESYRPPASAPKRKFRSTDTGEDVVL